MACALALLLGASCSEDSAVVRPEPPSEPAFSYELYCDAEGHITTDGPALALIRRPAHLERSYADAAQRNPRAVELVRELEVVIARAGAAMAERASAPHCLVMPELGCLPHWPFLDELLGDSPEAKRLREIFAHAYEARARQRGVENTVIAAMVNLLLAHGMVGGAVEGAPRSVPEKTLAEEVLEREATGFLGSKRNRLQNAPFQKLRNADTVIGKRTFSGHALDQMQNRGYTPSVVENAIQRGVRSPDPIPGRFRFYDQNNNITVITEGDRVITIIPGRR